MARERLDAPKNPLTGVIAEYTRGVRTPEMWTSYWRAKFQVDGAKLGLNPKIPDCNWAEKEIKRPMVDIRGKEVPGIMVPVLPELTLPVLGQMYTAMQSPTVRENSPVADTHDTAGWIKIYGVIDAPNLDTKRGAAEKFASDHRYLPGREITYILGSQAMKDFNNEYFDQGPTWSWLPGSQVDARLVGASFNSYGGLYAFWTLSPDIPRQVNGWRFEEVKDRA